MVIVQGRFFAALRMTENMLVKICGLQQLEHALAAAEAGADLFGMVFVPGVRRRITPQQARAIAQGVSAVCAKQGKPAPKLVGLFADQPLDEVNAIARSVGLAHVQLCGAEPMDYCQRVAVPPLKVLHVDDSAPRQQAIAALDVTLKALNEAGWLAVLDRRSEKQPGGLGVTFDWTVAAELAQRGRRFLLAGGLTPENVANAVRTVYPYGVDVSTGVETSSVKDTGKIRAFIAASRKA
ncbi:MAG: phosphoribosylanthranilate isomerase [Dehalococcoidia bacterium]|nr:phosphoribosylanthranilate isomerase [Dehalococcoidia bacterium]